MAGDSTSRSDCRISDYKCSVPSHSDFEWLLDVVGEIFHTRDSKQLEISPNAISYD
jgi:hypothetical protein